MAGTARTTATGAYVEEDPRQSVQVTAEGAYFEYNRLNELWVTAEGAYVEMGPAIPLFWGILVDWANNGGYATDEAGRVTALSIERGRADEFSAFSVGKAVLTLDNYDGRFDPWSTTSPIKTLVMPGRGVHINVTCGRGGRTYPLLYGKIEDIEPIGRLGKKQVIITVYDGGRDLIQNEATVLLQTTITTDGAIDDVLDAIDWPAGVTYRDLDVGNDTLAYWWTASDTSATKLISDLVSSEYGLFFLSHDGKATFINRAHRITGTAVGALDQANLGDIAITNPWSSIWNYIKVTANPISLAASAVIWTLTDTAVGIGPGQSIDIWTPYVDANGGECAATAVISPVAPTDYAANSVAGGGGTDMTASMTVMPIKYSTTAKLTITNIHPTTTLYITLLQIRGQAITINPTAIIREDTASQTAYSKRKLSVDVPWQQNIAKATDLANSLRASYSVPHKNLVCTLAAVYPDIFQFDLCDRIAMTAAVYDIDEVMMLGKLRLESGDSMQEILATFYLEPADNTLYWLLGVVGNSELGQTTRLGY